MAVADCELEAGPRVEEVAGERRDTRQLPAVFPKWGRNREVGAPAKVPGQEDEVCLQGSVRPCDLGTQHGPHTMDRVSVETRVIHHSNVWKNGRTCSIRLEIAQDRMDPIGALPFMKGFCRFEPSRLSTDVATLKYFC